MSANPLRWKCEERGCFNLKKRPKIEVFHDCFRFGINFGDVDMLVERRGHFLFGEWKGPEGVIGTGQRRLHEALVKLPGVTVLVIVGVAETMAVEYFTVRTAQGLDRIDGDLETLKAWIAVWFDHVEAGDELAAAAQ